MRDVEREPEVPLEDVYLMVVVGDARNLAATKELRVVQYTARLMEVAGDVNTLGAQRVQKDAQITVLLMVVAVDAVMKVVPELLEENLDFVSVMVVAKGAREKTAPKVLKAYRVFASRTAEVVDAKLLDAPKGHKVAPCFARHMVGGNGVQHQGALRVLRGAPPFARVTVEENAVHTRVVEFALKVFMEAPTSAWHTGVERGVLYQVAQRALEEGLIIASAMEEARDASPKGVEIVHKAALTSARHMGEARDALGATPDQNIAIKPMVLAIRLRGVKQVCVHFIVDWCTIRGSMEVSH